MWELLIIPVVVVGVWILRTLLQNAEEAKGAGQKPQKVTDLDRFLREVRRRKEAGERESAPPRRVARTEEPPPRGERRSEPKPRAKWRTAAQEEAIPLALPVDEPATAPMVTVLSVLEAPPLPAMPASSILEPRVPSAALVGIRPLLASRDGLWKAVILHEVLGPPLSRRRR